MNLTQELLLMVGAAAVGVVAMTFIVRRQRHDRDARNRVSPYATSTEGETRCPNCGMYNLWTDRNCISCHEQLPG